MKVKERIIFDNYDPEEAYPDKKIKEMLLECDGYTEEEIYASDIQERRNWEMESWWDIEQENITNFFKGKTIMISGSIGRWDGTRQGFNIGEFWHLFCEYTKDCGYWKLYDENGHFYITCSHHDGTNCYEVREITEKGEKYLDRCDCDWRNPNFNQLMNKYSRLPRFMEKVFGCKAREYENV